MAETLESPQREASKSIEIRQAGTEAKNTFDKKKL